MTGAKPRKIWIVRVPNDVADAIDKAPGGMNLGTLTMEGKVKRNSPGERGSSAFCEDLPCIFVSCVSLWRQGKACTRSVTLRPYSEGLSLIDFDLKQVTNQHTRARTGVRAGEEEW